MRRRLIAPAAVFLVSCICVGAPPTFRTVQLTDKFYAEGSNCGDFNRDGRLDVVAGPYWYEGPDFQKKHEIYEPIAYDPAPQYSQNFLTFVHDFNGDSWPDLLVIGFPGADSHWLENPGEKGGRWQRRLAARAVGNESPIFADITGDGRPELITNSGRYFGYASPDPSDPARPWIFLPISEAGRWNNHGCGVGDINGDGRMDVLGSGGWWEQPATLKPGTPWIYHEYTFAEAAAQMLVFDVNGDGLADVVTSLNCHHYGIVWHEQVRDEQGRISFRQHPIIGRTPQENPQGIVFTQHHALAAADFNGDGLMDFVTGKRFWAHGPTGDSEPGAPCVIYWFELRRDQSKGPHFVGHLIHDDSGVGTQVVSADLNGDSVPDIVVSSKKGTFLHLSKP